MEMSAANELHLVNNQNYCTVRGMIQQTSAGDVVEVEARLTLAAVVSVAIMTGYHSGSRTAHSSAFVTSTLIDVCRHNHTVFALPSSLLHGHVLLGPLQAWRCYYRSSWS